MLGYGGMKTKQQTNVTIQLEKINQNILTKEERLKRYRDRVKQYKQNWIFQNNERKYYQQVGEECTRTYQQSEARKVKQFWSKNITEGPIG